ncbi:hypothetical protein AB6A40_002472 [Gnathostoma spinigerum]|uniref:WASH complex subunit FAM21 n=1 Tax=Gnathostoma spinigerum TaxID=75299 RepID=A0ABD6EFR7_9BILA
MHQSLDRSSRSLRMDINSQLDAIAKYPETWSLSRDCEIRKVLESLCESLSFHIQSTQNELDNIDRQITRVLVRSTGLSDRFSSLSSHHFIENRVQDDLLSVNSEPTTLPKNVEMKPSRNQQDEMVDNVRTAFSIGIKLLDTHFKRITVDMIDDSGMAAVNNEDFCGEVFYEPLDPHLCRPLPFIIGSNEWNSSQNGGLPDIQESEQKDDKNIIIGLPSFIHRDSTASLKLSSKEHNNDEMIVVPSDHKTEDSTAPGTEHLTEGKNEGTIVPEPQNIVHRQLSKASELGRLVQNSTVAATDQQDPAHIHQSSTESTFPKRIHQLLPKHSSKPSATNLTESESDSEGSVLVEKKRTDVAGAIARLSILADHHDLHPNEHYKKSYKTSSTDSKYHGSQEEVKSSFLQRSIFDDDSEDDDLFRDFSVRSKPKIPEKARSGQIDRTAKSNNSEQLPNDERSVQKKNPRIPMQFKEKLSNIIAVVPKSKTDGLQPLNSEADSANDQLITGSDEGGKQSTETVQVIINDDKSYCGIEVAPTLPSFVKTRNRGPPRRMPMHSRTTVGVGGPNSAAEVQRSPKTLTRMDRFNGVPPLSSHHLLDASSYSDKSNEEKKVASPNTALSSDIEAEPTASVATKEEVKKGVESLIDAETKMKQRTTDIMVDLEQPSLSDGRRVEKSSMDTPSMETFPQTRLKSSSSSSEWSLGSSVQQPTPVRTSVRKPVINDAPLFSLSDDDIFSSDLFSTKSKPSTHEVVTSAAGVIPDSSTSATTINRATTTVPTVACTKTISTATTPSVRRAAVSAAILSDNLLNKIPSTKTEQNYSTHASTKATPISPKKVLKQTKQTSLFDSDDSDDIFSSQPRKYSSANPLKNHSHQGDEPVARIGSSVSITTQRPERAKPTGIFDDESDSDFDLFR